MYPTKSIIIPLAFAAARIQVDLVASIEDVSRSISKEIVLTPKGKWNYHFCYYSVNNNNNSNYQYYYDDDDDDDKKAKNY